MHLIKNYSVDIHIAMDVCGISFLHIDPKYFGKLRTLMTMYGSYFVFAHNVINDIQLTRKISFDEYTAMVK